MSTIAVNEKDLEKAVKALIAALIESDCKKTRKKLFKSFKLLVAAGLDHEMGSKEQIIAALEEERATKNEVIKTQKEQIELLKEMLSKYELRAA